jgi:hypothetical protein
MLIIESLCPQKRALKLVSSDTETLPAFGSTAIDNFTTIMGCHTFAETMLTEALFIAFTKRSY